MGKSSGGASQLVIGCDIGGTFTDFVVLDLRDGSCQTHKVLTTSDDPGRAVLEGFDELTTLRPNLLGRVANVVHGTTLAINALLERKGAVTAQFVTKGFRDTLEIRRATRGEAWDLTGRTVAPLVPRSLRFEVTERISSAGAMLKSPIDAEVLRLLRACHKLGVESIAVTFLHSYVDGSHERAVRRLATDRYPTMSVSLSSEVLPQLGEFERFSATAANAYLRPVVDRYLPKLDQSLSQRGLRAGALRMLASEGSQCSLDVARAFPIRIVESGPVGGVLAAQQLGELLGETDLLAFDIGGTTAKTCLILEGRLPITEDYEVARLYRFQAGSGHPLNVPSVDLLEIGTGGGSIVTVDPLGFVQVGPESAGSMPGPACYGRGGTEPTLTDCDVVLGFLDVASFKATDRAVDRKLARRAVSDRLSTALSLSIEDAALRARNQAIESMAAAIRLQVAHVGVDSRKLTLVAFGGAGPLYGAEVARRVGASTILIPPAASVFSALGMVLASEAYTMSRSYHSRLDLDRWQDLERVFTEVESLVRRTLGVVEGAPVKMRRALDLRYGRQGKPLSIEVPQHCSAAFTQLVTETFHSQYERRYGFDQRDQPIVTSAVRVTGVAEEARPLTGLASDVSPPMPSRFRQVWLDSDGPTRCRVLRRSEIGEDPVVGPAFIEEDGTTTFVPAGVGARRAAFGTLVLNAGGG